jgi:tRNA(Arg) A34 adenosine deaminase TadA
MCLGACLLHHVSRVVFGAPSPKFGACGSVVGLAPTPTSGASAPGPSAARAPSQARGPSGTPVEGQEEEEARVDVMLAGPSGRLNHTPLVQGGLLADQSSALMRAFFQRARGNQ